MQEQPKIRLTVSKLLQLRYCAEYEGGDRILQNTLCSAEAFQNITAPSKIGVVPTFPQNIS